MTEDQATLARQRELEESYDAKLRDVKAQQKRALDALERDRADWETRRRDQARVLADRAEQVRRQEENHKRDVEALRAARAELERLKSEEQQREAARIAAQATQAKLAVKVEDLRRSRSLAGPFAAVAVLGLAVSLVSALLWSAKTTAILASAFLAVALLVEARRRWGGPTSSP